MWAAKHIVVLGTSRRPRVAELAAGLLAPHVDRAAHRQRAARGHGQDHGLRRRDRGRGRGRERRGLEGRVVPGRGACAAASDAGGFLGGLGGAARGGSWRCGFLRGRGGCDDSSTRERRFLDERRRESSLSLLFLDERRGTALQYRSGERLKQRRRTSRAVVEAHAPLLSKSVLLEWAEGEDYVYRVDGVTRLGESYKRGVSRCANNPNVGVAVTRPTLDLRARMLTVRAAGARPRRALRRCRLTVQRALLRRVQGRCGP